MNIHPEDGMDYTHEIAHRLVEITGDHSFREVARRTGFHAETVRRYLQGASKQSVEFISAVVREYDADATVLLRGEAREPSEEALRMCKTSDLIGELSRRLVHMEHRVNTLADAVRAAGNHAQPAQRATAMMVGVR